MAESNPLTLLIPIKQDGGTQIKAAIAKEAFIDLVSAGLTASGILHYATLSLIPNPLKEDGTDPGGAYAILLCTVFDGAMEPYLEFFWENDGTKAAFKGLAELALVEPSPPVTDPDSFVNFITEHNLSAPKGLYRGYPQSVKEIRAKFKG